MLNKILIIVVAFLFIAFTVALEVRSVKADNLIIQDDGNTKLVISNNGVLGISTTSHEQKKANTSTSQSSPSSKSSEKIIPLVPPHTESTVRINPPINNGKQVQVVIVTQTASSTTQKGVSSPLPNKSAETNTNTSISKNVEQVVAQGSNGQPVITIKSEKAHELIIQQGSTQVKTTLPLQINTLTHTLSIESKDKPTTINVLPTEALQGIIDKSILNTQSTSKTTISLSNDTNGISYIVDSQKQGKLFGIFPVQSPVQIRLSAQNGKIIKTSQSPLFSIFGQFIK